MQKEDEEFKKLVEAELDKFGDSITPEERVEMRKKMYEASNDMYEIGYVEGYAAGEMMSKVAKKAAELFLDKMLKLREVTEYQITNDINLEEHRGLLQILLGRMFYQGTQVMLEYNTGNKTYDGLMEVTKGLN